MIKDICSLFNIDGEFLGYTVIKNGNINNTYRVEFINNGVKKYYIIQRINSFVFKSPAKVMENIKFITNYLKKNNGYTNTVLTYISSKDNKSYAIENNNYWRCYEFIDNSLTFNITENLEVIEESAIAFGEFTYYLNDCDVNELNIVIEDFHNPISRYKRLKEVIYEDEYDRVKEASDLIEEFFLLEELSTRMNIMIEEKKLPLRVVHNDTKCNNVLFDKQSLKRVAVIDLDTVMPGIIGFDFGDAIRFVASSASEDEEDVSKIYLDLVKFESFTKGYLKVLRKCLIKEEIDTLVLGCITITTELAIRFLTDYLEGDKYFKVNKDKHNLIRSRSQLALLKDMIKKKKEMEDIVKKYL